MQQLNHWRDFFHIKNLKMHISVADLDSSVFELNCPVLIRISNLDPEPTISLYKNCHQNVKGNNIYLYTGMHVFIFLLSFLVFSFLFIFVDVWL